MKLKLRASLIVVTIVSTLPVLASYDHNKDSLSRIGEKAGKPIVDSAKAELPVEDQREPLEFSGYVDANYFKNLNNPKNGMNSGLSGMARAFDRKENQFQLGMVQTRLAINRRKTEAVIDLTFGPHADLGNYGNRIGPFGVNVGTTALAIKQAYVTYKVNRRNSFTIGQFGTHIGLEMIEASINYHYSLSNLFNNGPFYHQGLKYTHTFSSKLSLMAGVVNNWDNLYDNNRFKTGIAQLAYTPKAGYSFYLNYIGGNEDNIVDATGATNFYGKDTVNSFKQMLDLVANMQVNSKLYFGLNAAIGALSRQVPNNDVAGKKRQTNNWGGVAVYVNYAFTSMVSFGLRGEVFDNTAGIQYIGSTDVKSITSTLNIKLDEGCLFIRPEFRIDIYKKNSDVNGVQAQQQFMDSKGNYTKNKQATIGAAVIYKF